MRTILKELQEYRNCLAHNQYFEYKEKHPVNKQKKIDAPSVILGHFRKCKPVIKKIEDYIHSMEFS